MIELIFIIVILAVLAAFAIPKLAATRDDARIATIAQETMTGATEISAYAVSRGMTQSTLSAMSNAVSALIGQGYATENGTDLTVQAGSVNDCLHLKIEGQGTNTEVIKIEFTGSGGDCDKLQRLIDQNAFPIPLRGNRISF